MHFNARVTKPYSSFKKCRPSSEKLQKLTPIKNTSSQTPAS